MNEIESLIFLVGAVAILAQLARLLNVPYPIVLVLGGLGIGFVPGLPEVALSPEIIFLVFLPPLLNLSASSSSPLDLRDHLRPITLLAIGLVLITTGVVALAAHYIVGVPWAVAFVLGAILAPTDPVAAEAIFRRLGVPSRVQTVVGGESLVNDGSSLAVFRVAVAAVVTGSFSLLEAGGNFLFAGGGGLLLGVAIAWVVLPFWARISDDTVLITVSLLIPYLVYILAENLIGVSGILAVVAYGLYQGWKSPRLLPRATTRLQHASFWRVVVFILESLLFVLVGQQFPVIFDNLGERSVVELVLYAVIIYAAVSGTRLIWFFTVPYLHPAIDRILRGNYLRASWQERLVMGWTGMRGGVSLAAALSIPLVVASGDPFPNRDLLIFLTFSVILGTLVLQGLTLGPIIKLLQLREDGGDKLRELNARLTAARSAMEALERAASDNGEDSGYVPDGTHRSLRRMYEQKASRYAEGIEAGGTTEQYAEESEAWRRLRHELLDAERQAILDLRDRGEISPELMHRIERDLDLEQSRIGG